MAVRKYIEPGTKFNNLTFLNESGFKGKNRAGLFRCICGNEKIITLCDVRSGHTKSCGCLMPDLVSENRKKHGHSGVKRSRAYSSWSNMISRCTLQSRPDYERYGGRGIAVCERWNKFENFLLDMGEPPKGMTLDRLDNMLGYEPINCRWASVKEQNNNQRSNITIHHNGLTKTLAEWADHLGIRYSTIKTRYRDGIRDIDKLFAKTKEPRTLTYNGKTKTIQQWSDEIGKATQWINRLYRKGVPVEEILSR